jgi:hypothetical protein
MAPDLVAGSVGTEHLPGPVRTLSALPGIDYADLFTIRTDAAASPEEWARAMLGNVPSAGQRFLWRGILGLRLRPGRSPETVAGWRVTGRGPDWVRLEARSWFLGANLVVLTGGGRVSIGTLLHYERRFGRLVWPPLSGVHRALVPGLLRRGAARIASR